VNRRPPSRPAAPPGNRKPSSLPKPALRSTIAAHPPPKGRQTPRPPTRHVPKTTLRAPHILPPPKGQVARVMDDEESSLLDVIDNLLSKGVMLNADVILALANVDLVYLRLSALLCAADRVLPTFATRTAGKRPVAAATVAKPASAKPPTR
jgi:hypothetical protein